MKKNMLIVTQVVDKNDSNLGFFCGWLKEFSEQLGHVYVIANKVGEYDLPDNVTVLSLGKEKGVGRFGKIVNFWKYLFRYLPKVDGMLVHMCPEYILSGGFMARLCGKKLGLWYLHKSLTWKLVLANMLANTVFTAHSDGYPIKSSKVMVTGHGINISLFDNTSKKARNDECTILTVGRISDSKNLVILVKSAILLQQKINKKVNFLVVGEAYLGSDKKYLEDLKKYIKDESVEGMVKFIGKVPHEEIFNYYNQSDVFLNASRTGGVDKAVLEAMISGLPVITSNTAFKNILPDNCLFEDGDLDGLVEKMVKYKEIDIEVLKDIVIKKHSLENTVSQIIKKLL